MANKRMITGDLFEDDISSEDYFTRLLWIGLIVAVADDQGRIIDNPAIMKARIFPFDENITDKQINDSLAKIGKSILRYSAGGKKLIQIVKWWKYQTPSWAAESKYPAPTGWTDKIKVHVSGNKVRSVNWETDGGFVGNQVPTPVHSPLPTPVPTPVHSPLNESDIKSDVKGESECEPDTLELSPIQLMIEKVTGLPPMPSDVKVMDEIALINPTQEDIQAAYDWYVSQGKKFRYYSSLIGPIRTAQAKRIQEGNSPPKTTKTAVIQDHNKRMIEKALERNRQNGNV